MIALVQYNFADANPTLARRDLHVRYLPSFLT